MSTQSEPYISPEENLRREREAPHKSEYFQGVIYPMGEFEGDTSEAMAGASPAHNRIKRNVESIFTTRFRKGRGCGAFFSDQWVHTPENGLFTPDVLAVCGKLIPTREDRNSITKPTVIVEAQSRRTAAYDRGEKFRLYRGLPALREYVLVNSRKVDAALYRKGDNDPWTLVSPATEFPEENKLASIGVTLALEELYLDTNLTDTLSLLREP